ncbi:MAG: inositol monophosphatase [Halobacteriales archaeon]
MTDPRQRAAIVERAAREGAAVAADGFRDGLPVELKDGKTDVVTQADRDAQRRVVEVIRASFPGEPVVGEEGDLRKTVPEDGPAWIVDPIDGTNNYVRDVSVWATSVAAVEDGEPVAAANVMPALGETVRSGPDGVTRGGEAVSVSERDDPEEFAVVPTYWWEMDDREAYAGAARAIVTRFADLRRFGSAQASLSMLAYGGVEGVVTNRRMHPWDAVAGVHMVREAGGTVTGLDGDRWRHDSEGLVASNGRRHDLVLAAARDI